MERKEARKYFAIAIMIILITLLLFAVYPFIRGFFGALIMYTLFNPFYKFLVRKNINKKLSAFIIILISIFVIIIPLIILLGVIGNEVIDFFQNPELIKESFAFVDDFISQKIPSLSGTSFLKSQTNNLAETSSNLFFNTLSNIGLFLINLVIMYFALYYMLISKTPFFKKLEDIIPFNEENSHKLTQEFKGITYTAIITTGIIGVMQGALLTITFLIFGVKGAFFWGFIAAILSFFPVIGPPLIWAPASIIKFAKGNYGAGTGILILGIFLSSIDNLIRPYLQKKIGRIHPLTTLIGIFIGIRLFGLLGIIIGPLIISYVLLILQMFREEYIE